MLTFIIHITKIYTHIHYICIYHIHIHILTYIHSYIHTVQPVYYGHLGTTHWCSDYQDVLIFQISLCDKAPFEIITKCVDYCTQENFGRRIFGKPYR